MNWSPEGWAAKKKHPSINIEPQRVEREAKPSNNVRRNKITKDVKKNSHLHLFYSYIIFYVIYS